MQNLPAVAFALAALVIGAFAQDDMPSLKAEARSALVWDKDFADSAASPVLWDPLTGNEIHKLSSAGIEVGSRIGYERIGSGEAGEFLNYTTTIANHTDSDVSVQYGGASVDGHAAMPLLVALNNKDFKKRDRKTVWELDKMHCFKTGFASKENFFSAHTLSRTFIVRAQTAMTISFVSKDPRMYSIQCSLDGCYVRGTVRYYIKVKGTDYVFVWPGYSVAYCGR